MSTSSKKDADVPGPSRSPANSDHDWMRLDSSASALPERTAAASPGSSFPEIPGYELLAELGRTATGVVYKARHIERDRLVAIKTIAVTEGAADKEQTRFNIEAQAMSRLAHANIARIDGVGQHDGRPYIVREFVDGPTLGQWLVRTPPAPNQAATLLEELARAVQHAHSQGVLHGDLKPAIVQLAKREPIRDAGETTATSPSRPPILLPVPKIVDFGLPRLLGSAAGQLGTPEYLAPEQSREPPGPASTAADIYSLGVMFYQMLTGRPPFEGASATETLLLHQTQEPVPPHRLRPQTPRDLETICLKCLEKAPGNRYASAGDLADDLARFLSGQPIQARPAGPITQFLRWRRANRGIANLLLATFSALLFVAALGWVLAAYLWVRL